jgi:hypothetical protein
MKIPSEPASSVPLDPWARPDGERHDALPAPSVSPAAMATLQDNAEALLSFNVWSDNPAQSQQLETPSTLTVADVDPTHIVQAWADYIFMPLR